MSIKTSKSLLGREFGKLVVVTEERPRRYKCICSCGKVVNALASDLLLGKKRSCGCLVSDVNKKKRVKIDFNKKYGLIKPIKLTRYEHADTSNYVLVCKCACGTVFMTERWRDIVSGHKKSCGCLKFRKNGEINE